MSSNHGEFFPESLMQEVNERFHHVDRDIEGRERSSTMPAVRFA
jgi:hypothetical protein